MKKILFLIPNLGHGGAERVLVNLANNLSQDKYEVTVQTLFDVGVNRQYLLPHVRYIGGWKNYFRGNSVVMKLFSPKFLYKRIVKEKYDIVISYLEGPAARVVAGCTDKATKKVCWIHTQFVSDKVAAIGFRSLREAIKCYNSFEEVVACGKTVQEGFLERIPTQKKVPVLYNVNETEKIVERGQEVPQDVAFLKGETNLCTVGRLIPVKAYERLLRVHKKLINEGLSHHLYVLGEGEEREKLENLIEALQIEKTAQLLGFQENPYAYVSKCDLFVCSSLREGFSTAVTEALVLGVPVVTTECSGMREQLGDNDEYGIVTKNSEEGLYEGLKKMLSNPSLLQAYKEKAKERGKRFSREQTVLAVEEFLDNL